MCIIKKENKQNSITQLCFFGYKVGWTISQLLFPPEKKSYENVKKQRNRGNFY